jgi:hypothetical protein
MAVDVVTLIYPLGRIHPDMFPDLDEEQLVEVVQGWTREAYAKAEVAALDESARDPAATVWAYYRAFDAACIALASNPATHGQTDAGTSSYTKDQRDTICSRARSFYAEFQGLAPNVDTDALGPGWTGGRTVRHNFAW